MTLEPQVVKSRNPWFPAGGRSAASLAQPYSPRSGRSLIGSRGAERSRQKCGSVPALGRQDRVPAQSPVTHSFLLSLSGFFCVTVCTAQNLQATSGARPLHPNSLGSSPRGGYKLRAGPQVGIPQEQPPECPLKLVLSDLTDPLGDPSGVVFSREHVTEDL